MLTLIVVNSCLQASEMPDTADAADAADAAGVAATTAGDAVMIVARATNMKVIWLYILSI